MDYTPIKVMAIEIGGIAFVVGLIFYIIKKSIPPEAVDWYFVQRGWLVNASVVIVSVALSFLGVWLNAFPVTPKDIVEYIYFGLFSAGMATLGYEFLKNWRK